MINPKKPSSLTLVLSFVGVALTCWLIVGSSVVLAAIDPNVARSQAPALVARVTHVVDEAHLRYVQSRSAGSHLFEEGVAHGTLPGDVIAKCNLGATFVASVSISTRNGSIRGHGTATPHASGIYESFSGTLTITGGTGHYAHAHGQARLYGVFNRRTYNLTVQTTDGTLFY